MAAYKSKDLDLEVDTQMPCRMVFDQALCVVSGIDLRCYCCVHAVPLIKELRSFHLVGLCLLCEIQGEGDLSKGRKTYDVNICLSCNLFFASKPRIFCISTEELYPLAIFLCAIGRHSLRIIICSFLILLTEHDDTLLLVQFTPLVNLPEYVFPLSE